MPESTRNVYEPLLVPLARVVPTPAKIPLCAGLDDGLVQADTFMTLSESKALLHSCEYQARSQSINQRKKDGWENVMTPITW